MRMPASRQAATASAPGRPKMKLATGGRISSSASRRASSNPIGGTDGSGGSPTPSSAKSEATRSRAATPAAAENSGCSWQKKLSWKGRPVRLRTAAASQSQLVRIEYRGAECAQTAGLGDRCGELRRGDGGHGRLKNRVLDGEQLGDGRAHRSDTTERGGSDQSRRPGNHGGDQGRLHPGPRRCSASSRSAAARSALARLQVADHADADTQPRIGGCEERVVLRLQADRREPELVDRGVGDAAV